MAAGCGRPPVVPILGPHIADPAFPPRAVQAMKTGALALPPHEPAEGHIHHTSLAHDGGDVVDGARDAPRQRGIEGEPGVARARRVLGATFILIAMLMMQVVIVNLMMSVAAAAAAAEREERHVGDEGDGVGGVLLEPLPNTPAIIL